MGCILESYWKFTKKELINDSQEYEIFDIIKAALELKSNTNEKGKFISNILKEKYSGNWAVLFVPYSHGKSIRGGWIGNSNKYIYFSNDNMQYSIWIIEY